jgi:hypothetical protein
MSGFKYNAQGPYRVVNPGDYLDYSMDWRKLLNGIAESISNVVWTVPTGITLNIQPPTVGPITTVWLTTPTPGIYYVSATMTTSLGRVRTRGFTIEVAENQPMRP